jgi:ankyrin repeat protein
MKEYKMDGNFNKRMSFMKYTAFVLLVLIFTLHGAPDANIVSLLRQRETHGRVDKKKIKISIAALQNPEVVDKLRKIDTWENFVCSIPKEYVPLGSASFEDNVFMDIIPAALSQATQEFKDDVFAETLVGPLSRVRQLLCIALIEAGANPNLLKSTHVNNTLYPITHVCVPDDYDFAKALLDRGANPNVAVDYWSLEHNYAEKHTPLVRIYEPKLAKLMVQYGADVKALSSRSKKTFLHIVSEEGSYPKELLQLYIDSGVDVNAKDSCGSTPLERIVLDQQSHVIESEHQTLQDKVSILLDNGADYHRAMRLVADTSQELVEDYPCYVNKYKTLHTMLVAHDSNMQQAARLRSKNSPMRIFKQKKLKRDRLGRLSSGTKVTEDRQGEPS